MSHPLASRRRLPGGRRIVAVAGVVTLLATAAATNAGAAAPSPSSSLPDGGYVVLLAGAPAAAYDGGVPGYAPTKPKKGKQYGSDPAATERYEGYLKGKQKQVADKVGVVPDQQFAVAANGFSATLTSEQASELAATPGVFAVSPDVPRQLDTTSTADFLDLPGKGGVWAALGDSAGSTAGKGIVVGVIDSGIWPESASFAGDKLGKKPGAEPWVSDKDGGQVVSFTKSDGGTFTGLCQKGKGWKADDCSTKLIGARYYDAGYRAAVTRKHRSPYERLSTRDGEGHGTHTAATAAGDADVPVSIDGVSYGTTSGMAPAAKIAAYKVCWEDDDPTTGGCYTSDAVAAIDQAVQDGVDVLNYSISGVKDTVVDPVEYAFFNAAAANVFVATSAGNDGPATSSVAHASPWVTTVAASSYARLEGTVVLGDGRKVKGASISQSPLPATPAVLSTAVAATPGSDDARLCAPGSLTSAAAGKAVLCDRGVYNRTDKSAEVKRVGGVAMVLANPTPNSLDADIHTIPTVHLDPAAGDAVRSYLASATAPTVAFQVGDTTGGPATPLPQLAGFSSRGPSLASGGDLLKPDLAAPGVSVIAAVSPPSHLGRDFDVLSGTSMASPHIAGLAALILGAHPLWGPMTVKSSMMTTAYDVKDAAGNASPDPFGQGAGQVDPDSFLDPGLFVLSNANDWAGYYASLGVTFNGVDPQPTPVAARDLNLPSIAAGGLTGPTTLTRTFTSTAAGSWKVTVDVPGFSADVAKKLVFSGAQNAALPITFTRTTAPLGGWATGFVTLRSNGTTVRLPVALQPTG